MNPSIRFSRLVRKALRFRGEFEAAKRQLGTNGFQWYPYDSFSNVFQIQELMNRADLSLDRIAGGDRVLDIGAADGALSLFFESVGYTVDSWDCSSTNMNRMQGIRALAQAFGSKIEISDIDLDARFEMNREYSLVLFLGTLYHLKNPFYALETLARHARFCFLSTRVARLNADRTVRIDAMPIAYLLDADECNSDTTNYWIFSPPGLMRLAGRAGWDVRVSATCGPPESDPTSAAGDERMFLLLESKHWSGSDSNT